MLIRRSVVSLFLFASVTAYSQTRRFENYVAKNLERVNGATNDFGASISVDDQTMLFVSDGRTGGVGMEDFWMSTRTGPGDGDWSDPIDLKSLNSPVADGSITMTADGQTFYFASNRGTTVKNDIDIWSASFGLDGHIKLSRIGKPVSTYAWESQPAISPDGKSLFFASNRPGKIGSDSVSNVDIFVSHLKADDTWSDPINLGSKINTADYDASPFLAPDGKTLFFASSRKGGKGGLDIYQSTWLGPSDTDWSEPIDLPEPINSAKNDFFFSIPATGNTVYFASDRIGGKGKFDIWCASPSPAATVTAQRRAAGVQISIDPNPAQAMTHVTYSLADQKHYTFSLEDLKGTKVLDLGAAENVRGALNVNLSTLASGVYLFVTTADSGERDVQRLAVIK